MKFTYVDNGIDAVIVDDFYTKNQLMDIHKELKLLTNSKIFLDETRLDTATHNGKLIASKHGIFLEQFFKDWRKSHLITHGITQTTSNEFRKGLYKCNTMYISLFLCNVRSHLLSYYENSDYYDTHTDSFFFTILNYFNVEPKQFSGGEVILMSCNSNKKSTIEPINNRIIVIPSCTPHKVKKIKFSSSNAFSGNGRYCNAMFLTHLDPKVDLKKMKVLI